MKPRRSKNQAACNADALAAAIEKLAPSSLAAEWDNVGMLAGSAAWPVRRALVTLDLTDPVADEALAGDFQAIVAYHPPIFRPIRRVTQDAESPTRRLPDLLARRIAIYSVHTAYDAVAGGTNDALLDVFDPVERAPLEPAQATGRFYKLATFVPVDAAESLRSALARAGAGTIGAYDECSFSLRGVGTFRGDATTNPTIGKPLRLERVEEIRLEMIVWGHRLGEVVRALKAAHPYEEPAYDVYPLVEMPGNARHGMGRIGRLARPLRGSALMQRLGRIADLSQALHIGDLNRTFARVAVGAGSFGVPRGLAPDTLYITGELKHHDALRLLRAGVSAICLGHAASERPGLLQLCRQLRQRVLGVDFQMARSDVPPMRPWRPRGPAARGN